MCIMLTWARLVTRFISKVLAAWLNENEGRALCHNNHTITTQLRTPTHAIYNKPKTKHAGKPKVYAEVCVMALNEVSRTSRVSTGQSPLVIAVSSCWRIPGVLRLAAKTHAWHSTAVNQGEKTGVRTYYHYSPRRGSSYRMQYQGLVAACKSVPSTQHPVDAASCTPSPLSSSHVRCCSNLSTPRPFLRCESARQTHVPGVLGCERTPPHT